MIHIISIIPTLNKIGGHEYWYHLALSQAATTNGWKHSALIPKQLKVQNIPTSWLSCLPSQKKSMLPKPLRPIKQTFQMMCALFSAFKKTPLQESSVIFYERFSHIDLYALLLALFLIRKKSSLWLFYRVLPEYFKKNKNKHLFLQKFIEKQIGQGKIKLMTDTDLLVNALQSFFNKKTYLMPIPHTTHIPHQHDTQDILFLWWPGGMREEKGLKHIQKLALCPSSKKHQNATLVVVEEMKQHLQRSTISIEWVKSEMPREEFDLWMQRAQVILLPYLSNIHYQASSSGLFVEAIVAGCMPLVSDLTWMSHELKKHHLEELILDWEQDDLLNTIHTLYNNPAVHGKLQHMQAEYSSFHCQEQFTKALQKMIL
ncbi:MAG: hypothetical protein P4L16_04210 [Chlamydiales bacterium]|nr:hypothetical protein [Chlamydiales bacterium]